MRVDSAYLGCLQRATKKQADFEKAPLRTDEEVARFAREHDGFMQGVNPLITQGHGGLPQPLPGVLQILREIMCESRFSRRPAVVLFPFFDPLLAVVALSTCHAPIVVMDWVRTTVLGK